MADLNSYFPQGMPSELQDMYSYLQGARQLPSIRPSGNFAEGTHGEYDPEDNAIRFDPTYPEQSINTTLAHEFSHAAHQQAGQQYIQAARRLREGDKTGPMDNQYVDAYTKLYDTARGELPPHPMQSPENERYRYQNRNEAQAFGIGNSLYPQGAVWPVNPHIDASSAQEQQVMMDLARRHALQTRRSSPTFMQELRGLFK